MKLDMSEIQFVKEAFSIYHICPIYIHILILNNISQKFKSK